MVGFNAWKQTAQIRSGKYQHGEESPQKEEGYAEDGARE
jgi:hypothetical protein